MAKKQITCDRCSKPVPPESATIEIEMNPVACYGISIKCPTCGETYFKAYPLHEMKPLSHSNGRLFIETVKQK